MLTWYEKHLKQSSLVDIIAQLLEHWSRNPGNVSSILTGGFYFMWGFLFFTSCLYKCLRVQFLTAVCLLKCDFSTKNKYYN